MGCWHIPQVIQTLIRHVVWKIQIIQVMRLGQPSRFACSSFGLFRFFGLRSAVCFGFCFGFVSLLLNQVQWQHLAVVNQDALIALKGDFHLVLADKL